MTVPSNGITAGVIRDIMPPYTLSNDLLAATFATLPAPPAAATPPWRHERATRLVGEIAGFLPADAVQARLAAEIVLAREMMRDTFARSNAPRLALNQVCRVRRVSTELGRTAVTMARELTRRQQEPVPFFGTVLAEMVDIAALDAVWGSDPGNEGPGNEGPADEGPGAALGAGAIEQPAAPEPATLKPATVQLDPVGRRPGGEAASDATPTCEPPCDRVARDKVEDATPAAQAHVVRPEPAHAADAPPVAEAEIDRPEPTPDRPDGALPVADAERPGAMAPIPMAAGSGLLAAGSGATEARLQRERFSHAAARLARDAGSTAGDGPGSVVTRLDQGPGWTLDVVRPRTGGDVVRPRTGGDAAQGSRSESDSESSA
jgi:hypothetical protein